MIGFFQYLMSKNNRLLFSVLLILIVFSFVLYTGSGSAMDLMGRAGTVKVFGVKINEDEGKPYRRLLSLAGAENRSRREYLQALAQTIYFSKLAEKMGVPNPSEEDFTRIYQDFLTVVSGEATPEAQAKLLSYFGINQDELKELIVLQYKIETVQRLLAGTPSCFPEAAEFMMKRLTTRWTVESARADISGFVFDTEPTDEELQEFFTANARDYLVPPQLHLAYAVVSPTDAVRAAVPEPGEADLKMFVQTQNEDPEKALAENRAAWVKRWKDDRTAMETASQTSDRLAEKLAQDIVSPADPNFAETLEKSGFAFTDIPAFSKGGEAPACAVPAEIINAMAGTLNKTLWRSDAIPLGENAVVILYKGEDDARIPAIDEVRSRVVEDWKSAKKTEKFLEKMHEKGNALVEAVKGGKDFIAAATELGFKPERSLPFAENNVPASLSGTAVPVIDVLRAIPQGEISSALRRGDEVLFIRAAAKDVPAVDKESDEYKQISDYSERVFAVSSFYAQVQEEVFEELAKTGLLNNAADE